MNDKEGALRQVPRQQPNNPTDAFRLAVFLHREGRHQEALRVLAPVVSTPQCPAAGHLLHGDVLRAVGCPGEAAGAYAHAVRADPSAVLPLFHMGLALEAAGVLDGAHQAFEQVLARSPQHEGAALGIGRLLARARHHPKAIKWLQHVIARYGGSPDMHSLLAAEFFALGNIDACLDHLEKHGEVLDQDPRMGSLRIRALAYDCKASAEVLFRAAADWARTHCPSTVRAPLRCPAPERRLRLGFVSSRLHEHNSSIHLRNLLLHRDPDQFEIVLFSDTRRLDAFSERLRGLSDAWYDIAALSVDDAATTVRQASIDILVDQHEHSNDSRLQLFGHKPAPLQVHWYANAVTTGLRTMDYRLSTRIADPPDSAHFSAEKLLYVPNYYLYSPSSAAASTVPTREPPAVRQGVITFGALHHPAKYNDQVLDTWRMILESLPDARLLLARNDFCSEQTRTAMIARLRQAGLAADRVTFEGDEKTIASLEVFQRMDCVLDSFPYNGVATTSDALWMGVPVLTLRGDRTAGRRAADQLTRVGHPEWIAESREEYVAKALGLAGDIQALQKIRASLHDEFARSALCNHKQTAGSIYSALRTIWRDACRTARHATDNAGPAPR